MGEQGRDGSRPGGRGHATRPHTADVILEAWGRDLDACFEEIVGALVELCVDASAAVPMGVHEAVLPAGSPESMLADLLDEVIFVLDVAEGVPIAAEVRSSPSGGLTVRLALADRGTVVAAGSVPKAVSRSGLVVDEGDGGTRCSVLVDV